ncbi:MAG: type II toxin-antitoxin system prevent-host-death family antitoxin [Propionibacteriaceae bacterium]|jgi:prevent-host-death family protein|nr:type II toxin-antitoxin system prevent-host-death family antitoxin [Propionibacteriaceae bacterium]
MGMKVGAYKAKTHFSQLLDDVSAGQTVTIMRHGTPVARLMPITPVSGDPEHVVAQFRQARQGVKLDGLTARDLIDEGRR